MQAMLRMPPFPAVAEARSYTNLELRGWCTADLKITTLETLAEPWTEGAPLFFLKSGLSQNLNSEDGAFHCWGASDV